MEDSLTNLCERLITELRQLDIKLKDVQQKLTTLESDVKEYIILCGDEFDYAAAMYHIQCDLRDYLITLDTFPENRFFVTRMRKELDLITKLD